MSKRLIRIESKNISAELGKLTGIELSVISQSGKTHFGKLISVNAEYVTMSDTRQHTHQLPITDIYEIVYDMHNSR